MASLLEEKFIFFNSLETAKVSRLVKRSVYIHFFLLINFPEKFELYFYFKYSRSYKVLQNESFETEFNSHNSYRMAVCSTV